MLKMYEVVMLSPPGVYPAWGTRPVCLGSPHDGRVETAMEDARQTFPQAKIIEVWRTTILGDRLWDAWPEE